MHLRAVFLVIASLGLSSCFQDKEQTEALANEIKTLGDSLEDLKRQLNALGEESGRLRDEISDYESKRRNLKLFQRQELETVKEAGDVNKYKTELETALLRLDVGLKEWKNATRSSFVGLTVPSFVTADGTALSDPVVVAISDDGVDFLHGGVPTTVKFANMPKALRERFVDESLLVQNPGPGTLEEQ